MADSDPISEANTPFKRRRLNEEQEWESSDYGEEITEEDFHTCTVATMPLSQAQPPKRKLGYTPSQMHSDLKTGTARSSSPFVTQPTQQLNRNTQYTITDNSYLGSETLRGVAQRDDILVGRSSPSAATSPPPRPAFSQPRGILASAMMAPPGTQFRRPVGVQVQQKPAPIYVDSDDDELLRSDEDTEAAPIARSKIKPTKFTKAGRGLDSTPNRSLEVIKESPRPSTFSGLMDDFGFTARQPANDSISAYANASRRPRPPPTASAQPSKLTSSSSSSAKVSTSLDEIADYGLKSKIKQMRETVPHESVERCHTALLRKKGIVQDALDWLFEDGEQDAPGEEDDADELHSITPVAPRGFAVSTSQSSQPVRPFAKQEIKASAHTIAERYAPTQAVRRSSAGEASKPRRRLMKGPRRSGTPPSSPPQQPAQPAQPARHLVRKKPTVVISDDEEEKEEEEPDSDDVEVVQEINTHDRRLLEFFNDCSIKDLADMTALAEDVVARVIESRPFSNLDEVRAVSASAETKSGKVSKARPIGDKIVDICGEVWNSYDAIDELVEECEVLAKPIQDALKNWGVNALEEGELQLMNLDEVHDSGIGTPTSSCHSDDNAPSATKEQKKFLGQPANMNPETTLKDYQLVGLNWLNLLWNQKISCILADDMGLGKTCQVISFLAHLQEEKVDGCALVIVPGSTLENWLREFKHFAPSLAVMVYYGGQKERNGIQYEIMDALDSLDVVVTTYDIAVKQNDNRFLRHIEPNVIIYDEAHVLRNPKSDRYKQLTRLKPEFRVLLTGTPLQNNLRELVAILGFIMPDMFSEKREELDYLFQHKATTKETENAALLSSQRIARARSIITPFILRRKKHQVLDLPTKHSRVEYCDMTASQGNYYADLLDEAQQFYADKATNTKAKPNAKASANILMSLRKAALHPLMATRLYTEDKIQKIVDLCLKHKYFADSRPDQVLDYVNGVSANSLKGGDFGLHRFCSDPAAPYLKKHALSKKQWMDSGKIAVFSDLVKDYAGNGDRVLVFSQFTTMMDILEAVLETLKIKFMRLDGSTSMEVRQDMIDTFTDDSSITVFMLSTRAGGAGINLAAANKVIILDSGFNPQDDIQAENRAHRVGQTREVEVIRLVTRGTIEEQIHALGESKLALDARVAGEGAEEDGTKMEKKGQEMVEKMLVERLKEVDEGGDVQAPVCEDEVVGKGKDLKDAFKMGMEAAGVKVASKQARF